MEGFCLVLNRIYFYNCWFSKVKIQNTANEENIHFHYSKPGMTGSPTDPRRFQYFSPLVMFKYVHYVILKFATLPDPARN